MTRDSPRILFYFHFIFHVCYHFYDSIDLFVFICYLSRMRRTSVYRYNILIKNFYDFLVSMEIHFTCHLKFKIISIILFPIIIINDQTIQHTRNKYEKYCPIFTQFVSSLLIPAMLKFQLKMHATFQYFVVATSCFVVLTLWDEYTWNRTIKKKKYKTTTYYPMIIVRRIKRKLRVPIVSEPANVMHMN